RPGRAPGATIRGGSWPDVRQRRRRPTLQYRRPLGRGLSHLSEELAETMSDRAPLIALQNEGPAAVPERAAEAGFPKTADHRIRECCRGIRDQDVVAVLHI